MIYKAEQYQQHATRHILKNVESGLFMEMGLGKTVVTLTALVELIKTKQVKRTLVIAPLAVVKDTWPDEVNKWDHTKHIRIARIYGTPSERRQAVRQDADIYLINCENVPWLIAEFGPVWRWDFLIIDELSKFKSAKSKRFKALKTIRPRIKRIVGLTGTPRPNSLMDLWSQLYLLDRGARLGQTSGEYKNKYFKPGKYINGEIRTWDIQKDKDPLLGEELNANIIYDKIGDICISMKTKDYINLPERIVRVKEISMSAEVQAQYDAFEEDLVMQFAYADKEVTVANAAVLTGKLLQFSNGAIYDDERTWHTLHDEKLNALEDIIEEAQGAPVLIFYNYKHDKERILKRFKAYKPRELKATEDRHDWNDGKIQLAIAHPKSAGHGLNLQAGGNIIVWFGLQWSLELYDQANARLHRRGQVKPVIIHLLLTKGTMDHEVLQALTRKEAGQNAAMRALKARVDYYLK